uniref:Reverse transcriptase domain-containing protein n=1 Tax=Trichuris muris TaxID=70415 RepID=A0A5S6Q532_TRIMR
MDSPLSPTLAEIFMENLEERVFTTGNTKHYPLFFKRYVDDMFAVSKIGNEEMFLEHLNHIYPDNITFTMEKEVEQKLPFLDALFIRGRDHFRTTVYRKPTYSGEYLHFNSHHPKSVFMGIVSGMVDRALNICDEEFLCDELRHIERTFMQNGYPKQLVRAHHSKEN